MKSSIVGLLAETSLHPGTESSGGVIDLPVAREVATGYPVIVGSSLKGSLRDLARQKWPKEKEDAEEVQKLFGKQDNAGAVAVTDARLLLLPVRSLTTHYKWVTCPYLLERYQRDRELAGQKTLFYIPDPVEGKVISSGEGQLFLEELSFDIVNDDLLGVVESVSVLVKHESVRNRLFNQLVILNDKDFAYYSSYGLQINVRNVLNNETKTSENLWYEETIPPDSLFYALLLVRPGKEDAMKNMKQLFVEQPYLQVGGNETIGQGWCALTWLDGEGGAGD